MKNGTSGRIRISSCFRHGLTVRYLTCSVHTGICKKWRIVQDSNLRAPIKRPTIFKIVVLWPLHQLSIKLVVPEGLEPSLLSESGFSYQLQFSLPSCWPSLWSGLYLLHIIYDNLGGCRQVSTPSFISKAWLGIAILQVSPNLTSFHMQISLHRLNFPCKSAASADYAMVPSCF